MSAGGTLAGIFGGTVLLDVQAATKEEILREIVGALCKKSGFTGRRQSLLLAKVLSREELGSTGIGAGAAVPHAKTTGLSGLLGAFARSARPIDYDAVDGEPVSLFFLLLAPEQGAAEYLETLSTLSRALRDNKFCGFLRTAKTKKDIIYALDEIVLKPMGRMQ